MLLVKKKQCRSVLLLPTSKLNAAIALGGLPWIDDFYNTQNAWLFKGLKYINLQND